MKFGLSLVGFYVALHEYVEKGPPKPGKSDERLAAVYTMIGATCEASEVIFDVFKQTKTVAKAMGFIASGMTIGASLFEMHEAIEYDNYGAVAGDGIQAFGAALELCAGWIELGAAEGASTGIGAAPALLAAIGALLPGERHRGGVPRERPASLREI
jgi:hypothetical protein